MHFKYLDINTDYQLLEDFAERCAKKKYLNNSTVEVMTVRKSSDSQTIIGLDETRIQAFAGCHNIWPRANTWRLGDRLVSLNRDRNTFKGIVPVMMGLLILWVQSRYGPHPQKFITTTNAPGLSDERAGKSHTLDSVFKRKGNVYNHVDLISEEEQLYGIVQNIYRVNPESLLKELEEQSINHTFEKGMITK